MAPIYVEPERLEIQGRVLAVLRKFRGQAAAQRAS
jgi:hypothetical protein